MTVQQVRDNFVQSLAENAYLNMCTAEEMRIVIEALEKQIPKKLKIQKCDEKTVYICECGKKQFVIYQEGLMFGNKNKYCEHCGQAIDWEGYRDENQPCE